MQIAVYGKGGIGKSTVSANLSAALASLGEKVIQIGCDPKHDSTRLLHHGQKITTVLDYILNTSPDDQKASDVVIDGFCGVGCIEAGGPRPGKGCAGRGILTSFDFLNKYSVMSSYSTVIYDVLGDVVCGGFAVPVRKQYAQAVFLVTSGEAMSIYAANNILCGIRNLDEDERRIAGIIYNSRGAGDEKERVFEFAKAVGLPVCLSIPRSDSFLKAERKALTQVEMDPDSEEAGLFIGLAKDIQNGLSLYPAVPLSDEQMELFMQGRSLEEWREKNGSVQVQSVSDCESCELADDAGSKELPQIAPLQKKRALSDPFSRMPLFGCAYRGAMDLAVQIKDAYVLGHAPKSCTSYTVNGVTSYGRNGLFARGIIYPAFIPQHYYNSDINIHDAVFGGTEHLRDKALKLANSGARDIIVVTACIPGLSGDDLEPIKKELKAMGTNMYIVKADGVEEGSYNEGMALCYKTIAREAVHDAAETDRNSINLVYELSWSLKTQDNYLRLLDILNSLGIRVNCRFLYDCSIRDVNTFLKAPYSLLARHDKLGLEIKQIFEEKYGCKFLDDILPMGFEETRRFVQKLGNLYSKEEKADVIIEKYKGLYDKEIFELRKVFEGKKAMIFLGQNNSWLAGLASDLKLDIIEFFLPKADDQADTAWRHRFSAEWEGDVKRFIDDIKDLKPDIVITSDGYIMSEAGKAGCDWVVSAGRDIGTGFLSAADEARRWVRLSGKRPEGRWKNDKSVFEKYYC